MRSTTAACLRFRFTLAPLAGVSPILGVNQLRSTPVGVLPEVPIQTVKPQFSGFTTAGGLCDDSLAHRLEP
ncbi:MAG: hypothetical protein QOF10_5159 [Kribbellaceae bacterium]|jgi:hypothetical protein|nr:hypothetical protein [Kribbellaceae bacterium]